MGNKFIKNNKAKEIVIEEENIEEVVQNIEETEVVEETETTENTIKIEKAVILYVTENGDLGLNTQGEVDLTSLTYFQKYFNLYVDKFWEKSIQLSNIDEKDGE